MPSTPTADIQRFFLTLDGFGPFAAANAATLVGRLDCQPFDSETVRHLREFHGMDPTFRQTSAVMLDRARQHYSAEKYGKWQFAVYWFEYWLGEERAIVRETERAALHTAEPALTKSALPSSPSQARTERKHWKLVAAQTRKRKQRSDDQPQRRSGLSASAARPSSSPAERDNLTSSADGFDPSLSRQQRFQRARPAPASTRLTRSQAAQMTAVAVAELRLRGLG